MIFERLPDVKQCCCFLPLKWGTVFIALFYMVLSAANNKFHIKGVEGYACYAGAYGESCPYRYQMRYFTDITIFIAFMYFLPSALLIVGVLINNRKIITVFLYFIAVSVLIAVSVDFSVLVLGLALPECGISNVTRVTCVIGDLMFLTASIYFIIVVKSFRSTLILEMSRARGRSALSVQDMHKTVEKVHVPRTLSKQQVPRKKSSFVQKFSSGKPNDKRSSSSSDEDRPRYVRAKKSSASNSRSVSNSTNRQSSLDLTSSEENKPKTSGK